MQLLLRCAIGQGLAHRLENCRDGEGARAGRATAPSAIAIMLPRVLLLLLLLLLLQTAALHLIHLLLPLHLKLLPPMFVCLVAFPYVWSFRAPTCRILWRLLHGGGRTWR